MYVVALPRNVNAAIRHSFQYVVRHVVATYIGYCTLYFSHVRQKLIEPTVSSSFYATSYEEK